MTWKRRGAASTEGQAAASYPEAPAERIHEGGRTKPQTSDADAAALCGKQVPLRTSIAREERSGPAPKLQRTGWLSGEGLMQLVA